MGVDNPLGIKYRVVSEMIYEGEPVRVVSGSANFETDLDDLWDAVTNPERLLRWFSPISGELKLGGKYQLEGNAGGTINRCDPPQALDLTWEFDGNLSWVRLRLDAQDTGARLTLEHLMRKDEASEAHWRKYGPGATGVGWDLSFLCLHLHLRSGQSVSQGETNAWFETDNGKTFIRECATSWANAHINSGEDESVANAMAQRTASFYCGE